MLEKAKLYQQVLTERERADDLLARVLPASVVERMKGGQQTIADRFDDVSVVFLDLAEFTAWSSAHPPDAVVAVLDEGFGLLDALVERCGLEKIKTIGDAYLAVSGLSSAIPDHVGRAVDFALAAIDAVAQVRTPDGDPLRARVGLHRGPIMAGVIGHNRFLYDVWGDTVNVASRLEASGAPGRVHVTEAVRKDLVGRYAFQPSGVHELKGKGSVSAYYVAPLPEDPSGART
jgi:class 3 adenylate cyclase